MSTVSSWLSDHKYELLSNGNHNEILKIRDVTNKSKKLLKLMDISQLDQKVVKDVVSKMNTVNEMKIDGLMKYKLIEVSGNSLYRISREYKVHLDVINPEKYFEESGAYEVLNGILLVLKVLNVNGLCHSDLKPSNIFLNDENEVKINDYLNNLLFKGRDEKKQIGKKEDLCFVSIDELLGLELDIYSDIYNYGLIFYYMLSSKYPFVGSNMYETMRNILNVKYERLKTGNGDDKLNSFLSKILQKEKSKRMKLSEIENELKKLNEPEIPAIVLPQETIFTLPSSVKETVVQTTKIDDRLKNRIDDMIEKCKRENGKVLNFWGFYMKDNGMKYLCSKLEAMNNVTNVNIQYNDLTSNGLKVFLKCLKFFPNLEEISLNSNSIGNGGLITFSKHLRLIPKLKRLGLNKCGLINSDIQYLSSHFKDIPNLEKIDISCNKIGDEGVKYLFENLNKIPKLKELNLSNNEISDIGGEILLNNLHRCKELKELWMKENKLSNYEDFKIRLKEKLLNESIEVDKRIISLVPPTPPYI